MEEGGREVGRGGWIEGVGLHLNLPANSKRGVNNDKIVWDHIH